VTGPPITVAVDTSVALPFVVRSHPAHQATRTQLTGRHVVLTTHSLAETYSVLTRLPGDARLRPADAAAIITANFGRAVSVDRDSADRLHLLLAERGIAGGAVYDALIGLAAVNAGLTLATRDARAIPTYAAVGAQTEIVGH
jgi:predicted nucleic acid-binding protein